MAARYAINIKTGSVEFRSTATEELKVRFRPIPDDVAQAIFDGKIKGKDVARIVHNKITADPNFDSAEFLAEELKLNVRRNKVDFDEFERQEEAAIKEEPKNMLISAEELGLGAAAAEEAPANESGEKPLTRQQKAALTRAAKKAEEEAAKKSAEEAPANEGGEE